jgi:hypothetical protein
MPTAVPGKLRGGSASANIFDSLEGCSIKLILYPAKEEGSGSRAQRPASRLQALRNPSQLSIP